MEKEIEKREKVIEWMYKQEITYFKDVAKNLKSYYYSPDDYMKKILWIYIIKSYATAW